MIHKFILVFIFAYFSCGLSQIKVLKPFYLNSESESGKNSKKFGLEDSNGKIIVEPIYDSIDQFDISYRRKNIRVIENHKMGLIDVSGKILIEPNYQCVCHFHEGLVGVKQNDLWGYIDTTGMCIIEPIYKTIGDFIKGKALVRTTNNQLFFIDIHGNLLEEFDEMPSLRNKFNIVLPDSAYYRSVESYLNKFFIDSSTIEYNLSDCVDGEGSFYESFRKMKYNIIYKFKGGWEWYVKSYRIPYLNIDDAVSLIKELIDTESYDISEQKGIFIFTANGDYWTTDYEIEEILPNIIEIRIKCSS